MIDSLRDIDQFDEYSRQGGLGVRGREELTESVALN